MAGSVLCWYVGHPRQDLQTTPSESGAKDRVSYTVVTKTYNSYIVDTTYKSATVDNRQPLLPKFSHRGVADGGSEMSTIHIPIRSVAKRLSVHENTIRNWIDRGILHAVRLPTGTRRVPAKEVERLEAEMFGVPSSFPELTMRRAPKPLPESAQIRPKGYPTV